MLGDKFQQPEFVDFYLPFGGKLKKDNRWVKLAEKVPWDVIEECYRESMTSTNMGAPSISSRIAYGALIIKERLGVTDEETVEQLSESPYLQYFVGLREFQDKPLFDTSMMVHFRSRFTQKHHQRINDEIIKLATESGRDEKEDDSDSDDPPAPTGKLLVDATCTPADITYPTDLKLLNEAREKTEQYIDELYGHLKSVGKFQGMKPRTYRQKARKDYLNVAKLKKCPKRKRRASIRKQLSYLRRNLRHIQAMVELQRNVLKRLGGYHYKCLLVIHTLYCQQLHMYTHRTTKVADRIVSISQPHVRPIVRGKASSTVEFGAKVSISVLAEGYVSVDTLSWDAYNETTDLIAQVESYKDRFGYYPESVHADKLYQSRANKNYCKEHGIRLSGKPMGRPKKRTQENSNELDAEARQRRQDEIDRIPVEGKFGNAKRKGTLQRIMAKLSQTSESVIHVGFVVLNLEKWLREDLWALLRLLNIKRFQMLVCLLGPCSEQTYQA